MSRGVLSPLLVLAVTAAAQQPAPHIQNGRVETRQATIIDRELSALTAGAGEPVWVGWRVPIADGRRGSCCVYSDDAVVVRGCFMEGDAIVAGREPQPMTSNAVVSLEAGTGLVILARLTDRGLERMRTLGDDCALDAGGRTVYWLQGVTPAESLKFLESLIQRPDAAMTPQEQRLRDVALSAVALHREPVADAILDRLATTHFDTGLRRQARSLLGSVRGAHGFGTLRRLLEQERLPEIRRQLVTALGQSRQPATAEVLLGVARQDSDSKVRAEAAYWLPQRGEARVISDVLAIIEQDTNDTVRQRAVQGLARRPAAESTLVLIQLAGTNANPVVRKEAVRALGRSKDPRAIAFLEELIRK